MLLRVVVIVDLLIGATLGAKGDGKGCEREGG
jgi:hypothetical protein